MSTRTSTDEITIPPF